jgi:cephalosporin hydroxylase
MTKQEILNLLTDFQKKEISTLQGIGTNQHYLGGPQLAGVHKCGVNIGWGQSMYKGVGVLQTTTDLENWIQVIDKYKPDIFIEMGVANGGNIIFINDLISKYKPCKLIGVDLQNHVHKTALDLQNFKFIENDTLGSETFNFIKNFIETNHTKRVLIHFDDHHESSHVFKELNLYSSILKANDIIIVGDTWDEGWYDSPFQALCMFLENDNSMYIDSDMNQQMIMPCNWIFGILIKK